MIRWAIVDTGPLVAFLDRAEKHHTWTVDQVHSLDAPLLICEPVLTEAMFLLARLPVAQNALFGLLENGVLQISFHLDDHLPTVRAHKISGYSDVPRRRLRSTDGGIVRRSQRVHSGFGF